MPTFATGAKSGVSYIAETVYGVTPAGTPKTARVLPGSKFTLKKSTFQSNELRPDRQIADLRYGNRDVSVNFPFQLSYTDFDDFLEAFMGGTWATNVLKVGNVARSFSIENQQPDVGVYEQYTGCAVDSFDLNVQTNNIVTGSFGLIGKDLIVAESMNTTTAVDSAAKTFTRSDGGSFIADGWALGMKFTTSGNADAGNNNTFTITTVTATVLTASAAAGLVTKVATAGVNFQLATLGTPSAATTNSPYDSFTGSIKEGGVVIATVSSIAIKGTNNLDGVNVIMSPVIQGITPGRFVFTGTLVVQFVDQTLKKKFINGTLTSLEFTLGSGSKMLNFKMSSVRYTGNDRTIGEKTIPESIPFQAIWDATDVSTMVVTRTP